LSPISTTAQQFTEIITGLPTYPQTCVAWGDYDGDGRPDVLVAGMGKRDTPTTTLFRNTVGGLVDSGLILPGLSRASAAWGDFDNDGRLDLEMTGLNSSGLPVTVVYRNNGTNFTAVLSALFGVFAGNGAGQELINLYQNNNALTNTVPAAPTALTVTNFGSTATFSWNAATDSQIPAAGLSYNLGVGTTTGGCDVLSPQAGTNGSRRLPAMGNPGLCQFAQLNGLRPGTNYFWSVQAVDAAWAGGPFAAEGSFCLPAPAPLNSSPCNQRPMVSASLRAARPVGPMPFCRPPTSPRTFPSGPASPLLQLMLQDISCSRIQTSPCLNASIAE
jgi:hypothetical protein